MRKFSKATMQKHLEAKIHHAAQNFERHTATPYDFNNGTSQCVDDVSLEFHWKVIFFEQLLDDIESSTFLDLQDDADCEEWGQ